MNWASPKTVRGWFVLIVLAALALSQAISLALLATQETILQSALHEAEAFRRTAGIVSLARNATPEMLDSIQDTASSPSFSLSFDREPWIKPNDSNEGLGLVLAGAIGVEPGHVRVTWDTAPGSVALTRVMRHEHTKHTVIITRSDKQIATLPLSPEGIERDTRVFVQAVPSPPPVPPIPPSPPEPPPPPPIPTIGLNFEHNMPPLDDEATAKAQRLDIAVALTPDLWLNVRAIPPPAPSIMGPMLATGALAAILLGLAAAWGAGRIARPIAELTNAANRLGRGDVVVLAPEEGPRDVRAAASAFNAMAARLRRLIDDQRALLSAVGHDLRTPISSLRIRTELVNDPELQARMLSSLEEIERLTEAALAAARGGETGEPTRPIDLPSLIEAVCEDLADTGQSVEIDSLPDLRVDGRASELRRALRNLIENAVRYGSSAHVSLHAEDDNAVIAIDDQGPGIPDDQLTNVVKPFVRLEASRSIDTGGHGLGLTIANAIAERHGGELQLSNRTEGGLRATLRLPLAD